MSRSDDRKKKLKKRQQVGMERERIPAKAAPPPPQPKMPVDGQDEALEPSLLQVPDPVLPDAQNEDDGVEGAVVSGGGKDGEVAFNPQSPEGHYQLDLADPYERTIAEKLQQLNARHPEENWQNTTLNGSAQKIQAGDKLPAAGHLELDFAQPDTQKVAFDPSNPAGHYRLNLENEWERSVALKLKALGESEKGENWKNEQVDGQSYDQRVGAGLPEGKVLELDYIPAQEQSKIAFDPNRPAGDYRLDLKEPWERAIAEQLLALGEAEKGENWINERIDGRAFQAKRGFTLPAEGLLELEFKYEKESPPAFDPSRPDGHYKLDLSKAYDRSIAAELVRLGKAQPGENWLNEQYNGKGFRATKGWVLPGAGILELDYISTQETKVEFDAARPAGHYKLDLSDASQLGIAKRIKKASKDGESLENIRIDGQAFPMEGAVKWPEAGILEVDFIPPQEKGTTAFDPSNPNGHYQLDLSNAWQKSIADQLLLMGSKEKGENWQNETLNGRPYQQFVGVPLPKKGILELDYISKRRKKLAFDPAKPEGHHRLDLTDDWERSIAQKLLALGESKRGENWKNESIDGRKYQQLVGVALPEKGILELDFINPEKSTVAFDPSKPNGHYRLDLADDYEFAVAQELWQSDRRLPGQNWQNAAIDGAALQVEGLDALPRAGALELDIVQAEAQEKGFDPTKPLGLHRLNLEDPWERAIAGKLSQLLQTLPGARWAGAQLDGANFEHQGGEDLPNLGILTLNFQRAAVKLQEGEAQNAGLPDADANQKPKLDVDGAKNEKEKAGKEGQNGPLEYVIQEGDSLESIAIRFAGTAARVDYILAINIGIFANADEIIPGLKIRIPSTLAEVDKWLEAGQGEDGSDKEEPDLGDAPQNKDPNFFEYQVKDGDTWAQLAQTYAGAATWVWWLVEANQERLEGGADLPKDRRILLPKDPAYLSQKKEEKTRFDPNNPSGHYRLELSDPFEYTIASQLVELGKKQPGENWKNETLNGDAFQAKKGWDLPDIGVLELDYIATEEEKGQAFDPARPAGHYRLNLSHAHDRAIALKLLNLGEKEKGENWKNESLDGQKYQQKVGAGLPEAGMLELDYVQLEAEGKRAFDPGNPDGHHRLDLADPWERSIAAQLMHEGKLERGENWKNETLNGRKFEFTKAWKLPNKGVLELDFIRVEKKRQAFDPSQPEGHYDLDLTDPWDRSIAQKLWELALADEPFENWINESLNGEPFHTQNIKGWTIPEAGKLSLDFVPSGREGKAEGTAFDPTNPAGHYKLDLSDAWDRSIATQLAELGELERGENWKNEKVDGKRIKFVMGWRPAESGILEFDYII